MLAFKWHLNQSNRTRSYRFPEFWLKKLWFWIFPNICQKNLKLFKKVLFQKNKNIETWAITIGTNAYFYFFEKTLFKKVSGFFDGYRIFFQNHSFFHSKFLEIVSSCPICLVIVSFESLHPGLVTEQQNRLKQCVNFPH